MHAAAIDAFGQPITSHTLPIPSLEADEVLIRVESAGVGAWDPFEQQGGFAQMMGAKAHFPYILGSDGAGIIVAKGTDVQKFNEGDRVYAFAFMNPKGGFYARICEAVKAEQVSLIPGNLTVEQAGALAVDGVTALQGLDALNLKAGESILIFGASGGIGHLAVQFAKRMGAHVFAVASRADGVAMVENLNAADAVIDGHSGNLLQAVRQFAPNGFDAALLTAGGDAANEVLTTLQPGARIAYPNGVDPKPRAPQGVKVTVYDGRPNRDTIARMNALIEKGAFKVHIDRSFPLDQASAAIRALEQHYLGKIGLHPAD